MASVFWSNISRIWLTTADNSLTSPSTIAKLSTTASSSRSCADKRCYISVSDSFSRSWVDPLPWPRPAEARLVVERPPLLEGARFELVMGAARLAPPHLAAFAADLGRVVRLPDRAHS